MTREKKLTNLIGFVSPGGSSIQPDWRDTLPRRARGQEQYTTFEANSRAVRRKLARLLAKKGRRA